MEANLYNAALNGVNLPETNTTKVDNKVIYNNDKKFQGSYYYTAEPDETRVNNKSDLCMNYPGKRGNIDWGDVLIKAGDEKSPYMVTGDFSRYRTLHIEMKIEGNGNVKNNMLIELKDNKMPDEIKDRVNPNDFKTSTQDNYQYIDIPLSKFPCTDLKNLFMITGFVFENVPPETVCVRNIVFLP